jgi:hypothetical protein
VPGQRAAAAAEFEHEPTADGGEEFDYAWGAAAGMLTVAPVVDEGEIVPVIVHACGVPSVGDGDAEMTREQWGQRD